MNKNNLAIDTDIFETEEYTTMLSPDIVDITDNLATAKINSKKTIYRFFKRTLDIIGSLIGMIILVVAILVIYIIRKLIKEDDGSLFYNHLRYGKNGQKFKLYKFRSMCVDADEKLKDYLKFNKEAKKEFEENQKLQNDPRITKIGKFLRKTSLDELPQMLNILKGEMSFVGPRPIVDEELKKYGKNKSVFLSVKPGLTGYWQVNGRSNTTYQERIDRELYYVKNYSFILDVKIFFKTFLTVLKKEGSM